MTSRTAYGGGKTLTTAACMYLKNVDDAQRLTVLFCVCFHRGFTGGDPKWEAAGENVPRHSIRRTGHIVQL